MGLNDIVWGPWLVALVLGIGVLATAFTGLAPLRGRRGPRSKPADGAVALAGSAGMGAIAGTAVAVGLGGPGAVFWMLVAAILGMGVHHAEGTLGGASRSGEPAGDDRDDPVAHVRQAPAGAVLAPLHLVLLACVAIVAGGAFQAQQGGAALEAALEIPGAAGAVGVLVLSAPFVFVPGLRPRLWSVVPAMLAVYVLVAVAVLASDIAATTAAIGTIVASVTDPGSAGGAAAGGGAWLAIRHGVMRATFVGETALGTSAAWARGNPLQAGRNAMRTPILTAGLLGTLTGVAIVASDGSTTSPVAERELLPLESPHSRGLRPSSRGQTIVLPEDTSMESGKAYSMVVRSNPRGHAFGRFVPDENAVVMPDFDVAKNTDTIVLRDTNRFRRDNPGWDLRIPCDRERVEIGGGRHLIKLTPKDPEVDLQRIKSRRKLSDPFVVVDDYTFEGSVSTAMSPDDSIGEHLAMFEQRADDAPIDPKLREFFSAGYRGPYPADGQPRPPWALPSAEGFTPEVGEVVHLELRSPPRGAFPARVDHVGQLEMPPWDFLADVREVVLRHTSDPSADLRIRVKVELHDGRFRATSSQVPDFREFASKDDYEPAPWVVAPPFRFDAETRSETRLPDTFKDRRALVPLHEQAEPVGPAETLPYTPHPGEVLLTDMQGPFPARGDGAARLVGAVDRALGIPGRIAIGLAVLLLGVTTVVAWGETGSRATVRLLGSWAQLPFKVLALALAAAGALMTTPSELLNVADAAVGILAAVGSVALLMLLPRLRKLGRDSV